MPTLPGYVQPHVGTLGLATAAAAGIPIVEMVLLPSAYGRLMAGRTSVGPTIAAVVAALLLILGLQLARDHACQCLVPALEMQLKLAIIEGLLTDPQQRCQPRTSGDVIYLMTTASDTVRGGVRFLMDFLVPARFHVP